MIYLLVLTFVVVVLTGPAFDDWRAERAAGREFPAAKVVFMLPSVCEPSDQ